MSDTVLVALISLVGIIVSGFISAMVASSLIKYRIDELEKKVDEHNGYAKKFADTSKDIALIQKDIEHIKERFA